MRSFWPPAEAAQADYERLRAAVLAGTVPIGAAVERFARDGLVGLITRPVADPEFVAVISGARRPAWTPHRDPRLEVLAAGYALVLGVATDDDEGIDNEEEAK
jgi:hypothetical protein